MKIISFAYTTPALLAGRKTVTRRNWKPGYAASFRAGERILAYDRSPRIGGKPAAIIELTDRPKYEADSAVPDSDYEAEGFAYLNEHPELLPKPEDRARVTPAGFIAWKCGPYWSWVVRFKLIQVL